MTECKQSSTSQAKGVADAEVTPPALCSWVLKVVSDGFANVNPLLTSGQREPC